MFTAPHPQGVGHNRPGKRLANGRKPSTLLSLTSQALNGTLCRLIGLRGGATASRKHVKVALAHRLCSDTSEEPLHHDWLDVCRSDGRSRHFTSPEGEKHGEARSSGPQTNKSGPPLTGPHHRPFSRHSPPDEEMPPPPYINMSKNHVSLGPSCHGLHGDAERARLWGLTVPW